MGMWTPANGLTGGPSPISEPLSPFSPWLGGGGGSVPGNEPFSPFNGPAPLKTPTGADVINIPTFNPDDPYWIDPATGEPVWQHFRLSNGQINMAAMNSYHTWAGYRGYSESLGIQWEAENQARATAAAQVAWLQSVWAWLAAMFPIYEAFVAGGGLGAGTYDLFSFDAFFDANGNPIGIGGLVYGTGPATPSANGRARLAMVPYPGYGYAFFPGGGYPYPYQYGGYDYLSGADWENSTNYNYTLPNMPPGYSSGVPGYGYRPYQYDPMTMRGSTLQQMYYDEYIAQLRLNGITPNYGAYNGYRAPTIPEYVQPRLPFPSVPESEWNGIEYRGPGFFSPYDLEDYNQYTYASYYGSSYYGSYYGSPQYPYSYYNSYYYG